MEKTQIRQPPASPLRALGYTGPGFILSAALVGSGELIVTTALGAQAGWTFLWFVLFSCVVKVALQIEYGKYCICHTEPTFQAWNRQTTAGKIHWSNKLAALFFAVQLLGFGGVLGGTAQSLTYLFPSLPLTGSLVLMMLLPPLLIFHGKYKPIETLCATLNGFFTLMILYCVLAIQSTEYAVSTAQLREGFRFTLTQENVVMAIGLFGITGMAAAEIVTYPYWCIEKGYAAWTGPRDDSPEWLERARGWIGVMKLDAVVSLIIYTTTTCAFYCLGAAVLSKQPRIADGNELILQLSAVFTESIGSWSMEIFMLCAFFVLFSTLFGATAGATRVWTDLFDVFGWIDASRETHRKRSIALLAWGNPILWAFSYFVFQQPLFLVVIWGIANSLFLVVVAYQGLRWRYQQTLSVLRPGIFYDIALWLAFLSFCILAAAGFINSLRDLIARFRDYVIL